VCLYIIGLTHGALHEGTTVLTLSAHGDICVDVMDVCVFVCVLCVCFVCVILDGVGHSLLFDKRTTSTCRGSSRREESGGGREGG
jgi:hypothetical protein